MNTQTICQKCGWKITESGGIQWVPEDWYCVKSECELNNAFDYKFFGGDNDKVVVQLCKGIKSNKKRTS